MQVRKSLFVAAKWKVRIQARHRSVPPSKSAICSSIPPYDANSFAPLRPSQAILPKRSRASLWLSPTFISASSAVTAKFSIYLPPTEKWEERISAFFGNEISDALIPISGNDGQVRLWGFVCDPTVNRSNNRLQYLFLNGRHIRDRALQHALSEAYRGLLMVGRFPVCFMQLEMPPELVDVNVHPTKLEVRFADGGRVYAKLLQTLRHTFLSTDLTAKVRTESESREVPSNNPSQFTPVPALTRQSELPWRSPAPPVSTVDLSQIGRSGSVPSFRPFPTSSAPFVQTATATGTPQAPSLQSPTSPSVIPTTPGELAPWERADPPNTPLQVHHTTAESTAAILHPPQLPSISAIGFQVHNRYLITEDEKGMVIIDQHALHERILYEQIRERVLSGKLETQMLLVPEPVSLTPADAAAAFDSRELFQKVGIEIEPFGGDAVLVRSYPAMLANMNHGYVAPSSRISLGRRQTTRSPRPA